MFFVTFEPGFVMTDTRASEEAIKDRGEHRPAFSWPGRRRADEAAEAAERAALEGLERLRGRTSAERPPTSDRQAQDAQSREELRALVFEATQQLRDAIKIEANELGSLIRAEQETLKEAIESLRELTSELRAADPDESPEPPEQPSFPVSVLLDLNEASHEDLCAIGMSETQASRVIRHRDFWGDFESVSELDHVPGFPPAVRAELEQRLVVWGDEELLEAD